VQEAVWCRKQYGADISEPQFYTVRRSLQDAAGQPRPTIGSQVASAVLERAEKVAAPALAAPPAKESLADLIRATRTLVDKLGGKEEAKSVIDAL